MLVYGFSGNVGRMLYSSPSESVVAYCIADRHLRCGISPSFVLSEEKDSIEILLGPAAPTAPVILGVLGLSGLALVAREGRASCCGFESSGGRRDTRGPLLFILSPSALCPRPADLPSLAAARVLWRGEWSSRASFLDFLGAEVETPGFEDDLGL